MAVLVIVAGAGLRADSKKKGRVPQAIITGTVFESSGRLLPGAKVEAVGQQGAKFKESTMTDEQGDFAIRVPAGRATYLLTATAKGFQPQQKSIEVYEDERVRANLLLSPAEAGTKK